MRGREFIDAITATAAVGVLPAGADEPKGRTPLNRPKENRRGDRLNRQLGLTKEEASLIGLSGHPVGRQKDRTDRMAVIRTAIDAGITLLENCRA